MRELVFNIMRERDGRLLRQIPLRVVMPHQNTALRNHHQSLGNLNQRGGLSAKEMLHVLYDLPWYDSDESKRILQMTQNEADAELMRVVKERYTKLVEAERIAAGRPRCAHGDRPDKMDSAVQGARRCNNCGEFVFD